MFLGESRLAPTFYCDSDYRAGLKNNLLSMGYKLPIAFLTQRIYVPRHGVRAVLVAAFDGRNEWEFCLQHNWV